MSTLLLKNVGYRYKKSSRNALENVGCQFESGKVYAVIGPSGSGKTTLLSILAGLDRPQSGEVYIDGTALSELDLDAYRRDKVTMVFQAFQLFPALTALENVSFCLEIKGIARAEAEGRAKELLTSVGIDAAMAQRFPANLSGGEQQRVAIARALASGAQVILADEPTGNLDGENGEKVMTILNRLAHDEDYCVIVVTHDPQIAANADRVFRMADGRLGD